MGHLKNLVFMRAVGRASGDHSYGAETSTALIQQGLQRFYRIEYGAESEILSVLLGYAVRCFSALWAIFSVLVGHSQTTPTALDFLYCCTSAELERSANHMEVMESEPALELA